MTKNPNSHTPFLERFQNWAAFIGAFLITFFAHPYAFAASVGFVSEFGETHYGIGWAIPSLWWLLTFGGMMAGAAVILKAAATTSIVSFFRRFA